MSEHDYREEWTASIHAWMSHSVGAARGLMHIDTATNPSFEETVNAAIQDAEADRDWLNNLLANNPLQPADIKRVLRKILQRATEILDREAMTGAKAEEQRR